MQGSGRILIALTAWVVVDALLVKRQTDSRPQCFSLPEHFHEEINGEWRAARKEALLGKSNCIGTEIIPYMNESMEMRCILNNPVAFVKDHSVKHSRDYIQRVATHGFNVFEPSTCTLETFESEMSSSMLRNRTIFMAGDSTMGQQYVNLLGSLAGHLDNSTTMQHIFREHVKPDHWKHEYQVTKRLLGLSLPNTYPGVFYRTHRCEGETGELSNCANLPDGLILCWYSAGKDNTRTIGKAFKEALAAGLGPQDIFVTSLGAHYGSPEDAFGELQDFLELWQSTDPDIRPITIYREAPPQMFKNGRYDSNEKCGCVPYPQDVWTNVAMKEKWNYYNSKLIPRVNASGMPVLHIWQATALLNATEMREGDCNSECIKDGTHYAQTGSAYSHWNILLLNQVKQIEIHKKSSAKHSPQAWNERLDMLRMLIKECDVPDSKRIMSDYETALFERSLYGEEAQIFHQVDHLHALHADYERAIYEMATS